jgi:hypothetical protein
LQKPIFAPYVLGLLREKTLPPEPLHRKLGKKRRIAIQE